MTSRPAIEVESLVKRFGRVTALQGVDLSVEAQTVFGLLGPNGAGKTTAVRILTTILTPDEGRAEVLGFDVVRQAPEVRTRIGLAGQYAAVDENLTGRENLQLVGRLTHLPRHDVPVRADRLIERFGLDDAADRPVRTYSGGMRRRLDVAAALVHRPPVLFLDEPTNGLDPRSRKDLWEVIGELVTEGTTVLLTSQYLEEVDRLADRIAVVDEGRVIAEGTAAELKASMGRARIEIRFTDPAVATQAEALLVRTYEAVTERHDAAVLVEIDEPRAVLGLLGALDGHQLMPASIAFREPTLDDVFLALTGRHAHPASEPQDLPTGHTSGRADGR